MSNSPSASFEIEDTEANPAWDVLVAKSLGAHYAQTTPWARAKRPFGWQAYRILVRRQGRLIGGAQVLHRRVRKLLSIGFISRGPVFESAEVAALVTQQVVEALKEAAHSYLVLLPHYEAWAQVIPVLTANGFFPKPNLLPPSELVTATIVIDLNQDLDTIFSKIKSKTRQYIRRGVKDGIEVTQGGEADIPTFHRLMCQLCARRGTTPNPAQVDQLYAIWLQLAPAGMVKLFIARFQTEEVSAALAFVFGGTIWVWKAGWSGEHDERRPNQVLWWEIIKWSKAEGLRLLDFEQILPEHAKAILRGETVEDSYWGVTQFKVGFGGEIVMIPDSYYRTFNRGGQALLKLGGAKFLAFPLVLKWAARARG